MGNDVNERRKLSICGYDNLTGQITFTLFFLPGIKGVGVCGGGRRTGDGEGLPSWYNVNEETWVYCLQFKETV